MAPNILGAPHQADYAVAWCEVAPHACVHRLWSPGSSVRSMLSNIWHPAQLPGPIYVLQRAPPLF